MDEAKRDLLRQRSVEPFVALLADFLANAPTAKQIREVAARRPGEWANIVKIFAQLSGYTEKREVEHTGIIAHIAQMGDAELMGMLRQFTNTNAIKDRQPCINGIAEPLAIETKKEQVSARSRKKPGTRKQS